MDLFTPLFVGVLVVLVISVIVNVYFVLLETADQPFFKDNATQTLIYTMEAEIQSKYAHHHVKHVAVNTTWPDNVKFHGTQTEIIYTSTTTTQRHPNITLDAAVQATLMAFKDTVTVNLY